QPLSTLFPYTTLFRSYMLGKMKQKTYGMTINMQINLTPDMSIQFYGSPFTSIANFNEFKQATNTQSSNYTERFKRFSSEQLSLKDRKSTRLNSSHVKI